MHLPKEIIQDFELNGARVEDGDDILDEEGICTQGWEEGTLRELEDRGMEIRWTLYAFDCISLTCCNIITFTRPSDSKATILVDSMLITKSDLIMSRRALLPPSQ